MCVPFVLLFPSQQDFRKKLIGLTDVTHQFFDKLVKQLERGLKTLQADYAADVSDGV